MREPSVCSSGFGFGCALRSFPSILEDVARQIGQQCIVCNWNMGGPPLPGAARGLAFINSLIALMEGLVSEICGVVAARLPLKDSMRLAATSKQMKILASDISFRDSFDLSRFFISVASYFRIFFFAPLMPRFLYVLDQRCCIRESSAALAGPGSNAKDLSEVSGSDYGRFVAAAVRFVRSVY